MSEIISEFAADFLSGGRDIYEKQNFLNCACTAWNISLFPEEIIEEKINSVVAEYEKNNPNLKDSDNYRHNLKQLIERKFELYSEVRRSIIEAYIEDDNDKNRITVVSMPLDQ
jgi:hypothetical protein